MPKYLLSCQSCGFEFKSKRSEARFCDSHCYGDWKSASLQAFYADGANRHKLLSRPPAKTASSICAFCGAQFKHLVKLSELRKYCSRKCYLTAVKQNGRPTLRKPHNRNCQICGTSFRARPLNEKSRFCSNKCRAKWIKDEGIFRGANSGRFGRPPSHPEIYLYEHKGIELKLRSSWELNVAQYLDNQGLDWDYEPERFNLGDMTYVPDFRLNDAECFWEVKGWFSDLARLKTARFREMYPEHPLVLITLPIYAKLKAQVEMRGKRLVDEDA